MSQISYDVRKCPICKRDVRDHNRKGNVRKTDECKITRGKVCNLLNQKDPAKAFRFGSRTNALSTPEN